MNRPEPIELENNLGPDAVTGEINRVPWMAYDVDEMDLYIAEKDAEIAELKNYADEVNKDFELVDNQNERLLKIVRHNKYKRCLAMARWCHNQREIYERDSYNWELDDDAVSSLRNKANIMRKWRKRWLALAEKFKEAK